jgi:DNA-binding ferritin-like protein
MTIQRLHDSTAVCFVPSGLVPSIGSSRVGFPPHRHHLAICTLPRKVPNTVLKLIPNLQAFLEANNLPNLGTIFLMYAPTVYIMWRMDERFDKVDERFAKVDERLDERFDKVDERFTKVDERMDERFDKVDERFDKVDERFDKVDGQANHLLQGLNNLTADVGELKGKVEILTRLFPYFI